MKNMFRRRAALIASLLAALLPLSHAQAQTAHKIRYEEVVRSVLYVPMYVGIQKGMFNDAGIEMSMKTSQGTDKGMAALLSGSADIVLIGPEASIYVANSESPVKPIVFAGLTATDGFLLMGRKPDANFDWSKLKGSKIMSFRPGSNPDIFLEAALRKKGLDPKKDLTLVSNIGPAARTGAWLAGQNDYATFLEPEASSLEKQGKAFPLGAVGKEVGMVDYTVFTTTDAYLKKNRAAVQAWTQAVAKAQQYTAAAPAGELADLVGSYFTGLSKAELVSAIERYQQLQLWKKTPMVEKQAMDQLQDMLVQGGVLEAGKKVDYARFVDMGLVQSLAQK
ncbi:ABC transporter substrate-binding protein [Comamonas sp. MYb21]|uniref:ABC transporter substrate-binding protein n=1 Tax=Comamonas sp. MYb21 TaxID=1848648 RepID=UPI003094B42D